MFIVTDFTKPEHPQHKATNVDDIGKLVWKITHNRKEVDKAISLANDMGLGGKYEFGKYMIECISEKEYLWRKRWKIIINDIREKDDEVDENS
jgi:hypothetical protein